MKRYTLHSLAILASCLLSLAICDRWQRGSYEPLGHWMANVVNLWRAR